MKNCLKISLFTLIVASTSVAAPLCVVGTYTSYQALGSGGCSLDAETFSAFSDLAFSNSLGVPVLSKDQITITPGIVGDTDSLAFSYTDSQGAPLTVSLNQNGQVFAFSFTYLAVATSPAVLYSVQMESSFGNTSPGSVSASKNAQIESGGSVFVSAVTDGGASNPFGTYLGPVTPVIGDGPFVVNDAISLQAQAGAVSDSGFTNLFSLGESATPEPHMSLMVGSGLLLIGSLLRKIKP